LCRTCGKPKERYWNQKVVSVQVVPNIAPKGRCGAAKLIDWYICPFPRVYRHAEAYPLPRKMPDKAEKSCTIQAFARYGDRLEVVRLGRTYKKAESRQLKKSLICEQFRELIACGPHGMRSSRVPLGPNVACRRTARKADRRTIAYTVSIIYKAPVTKFDNQE
jgi:hypothetical protein